MKKLFISCPMKGRTDAAIKDTMQKLHKMAEIIMGEELEVIDSLIEDAPAEATPLWYLGESLKKLDTADVAIGCPHIGYNAFPGCSLELRAASTYGIRVIEISEMLMYDIADDLYEVSRRNVNVDVEVVQR